MTTLSRGQGTAFDGARRGARRGLVVAVLLALLVLPGCRLQPYRFLTGLPRGRAPERTVACHFFFWGWLGPTVPVDVEALCPEGVAEFGSYVSFGDWLCALFTVGFYAPRTAYAIPTWDTRAAQED